MTVVQSLKMKSKIPTLRLGYILVCLAVSIAIPIPPTGASLKHAAVVGFESSRSLAGFLILWFILSQLNIIPRSWNRTKTNPRKRLQLIEPFDKMRHWNPSDRVSLQMSADVNKGE